MTAVTLEIESYEYKPVNNKKDIPVLPSSVSYDYFFKTFLISNHPCIIKNISDDWNATNFWFKDGDLDFKYLRNKYGKSQVTIYDCKRKYFNSHETSECSFEEYLNYWQSYNKHAQNDKQDIKYLKDWHLKNEYPDDNFYEVPIFFASDWLNEYLVASGKDDYRFVYMGPQGTWTSFHADVFRSYSWSTNVYGKKRWILLPPGEENKLKDPLGNLCFDLNEKLNNVKFYEVIQETGDAIFVPSGWHHQVWNLDNTVSINHNWINGCNILTVWKSLVHNLELVKKEIEDCKSMDDFDGHCQIMLNSSFGMNFYMFYDFISFIALKRLLVLQENNCDILYNNFSLGRNHVIYDLKCIKTVLDLFIKNDDINNITLPNKTNPQKLLESITMLLTKKC